LVLDVGDPHHLHSAAALDDKAAGLVGEGGAGIGVDFVEDGLCKRVSLRSKATATGKRQKAKGWSRIVSFGGAFRARDGFGQDGFQMF
jgi:hypothetical protein